MKMQWLAAAALAMTAGSAFARDATQDEHSILHNESAICDAFEASDGDSLRNRLDEHFTLTDSKGVVTDRDRIIADVAKGDPTYLMFRNHGQKVHVYGDAAIVTGITTVQGHDKAGSTFASDYAYTDTWIYEDSRWMLAASHASFLRDRK